MTSKNSNSNFHSIIILGCGPASLSCAVQLHRSDVPFFMIAEEIGGLIRNANLIENLLGYPNGIKGSEFVSLMQETIKKYEIPIERERVTRAYKENKEFIVETDTRVYRCEFLIIGTGTEPIHLGIPGEEEIHHQNRLFYDVYKDEGDLENLQIGIIGSGDAAYDYALNLSRPTNTIDILQRTEKSKALPLLIERVKENANISVRSNTPIDELKLNANSEKVSMISQNKLHDKEYDKLFVAIGRRPNNSFLSEEIALKFPEIPNLWLIGDIKNDKYRQLAIAMADGIRTAMQITAMLHK